MIEIIYRSIKTISSGKLLVTYSTKPEKLQPPIYAQIVKNRWGDHSSFYPIPPPNNVSPTNTHKKIYEEK